jgi:excisionase family DNA binding protein
VKDSKFFSIKELSEYISVKPKTLYSWVSRSVIPFYRLQGVIRFRKGDIDRWLKDKCKSVEGIFGL